MASHPVAIPHGSVVLITGVSGFTSSHVALAFLEHGYRVRGAVRNRAKAVFLSKEPFARYAEDGSLELCDIPDMAVEGAYADAVRGVSAVVNVANMFFPEPDPDEAVAKVTGSLVDLLRVAAAERSVERFVHCSTMATMWDSIEDPAAEELLTADSWNETSLGKAHSQPGDPHRPLTIYMARKVEAERAAWRFVGDEKPGFVFNSVEAGTMFGRAFTKGHFNTTPGLIAALMDQPGPFPAMLADVKHSNIAVKDAALLHLAAAVDPAVEGRRIVAASNERLNLNDVLAVLRRTHPDQKWRADIPEAEGQHGKTLDNALALPLLEKWGGHGWTPMEVAVKAAADSVLALLAADE